MPVPEYSLSGTLKSGFSKRMQKVEELALANTGIAAPIRSLAQCLKTLRHFIRRYDILIPADLPQPLRSFLSRRFEIKLRAKDKTV